MTTYIEKLIDLVGCDLVDHLDKFTRPEGAMDYIIGTSKSIERTTKRTYETDTTYWLSECGFLHKAEIVSCREDESNNHSVAHICVGFADRFQIAKICQYNEISTEAVKLLADWLKLELETARFLGSKEEI